MSTITVVRHVPVDPERAFAAWVDPAELARWWWPQWPDTTYEVDAHDGGRYRIHSAAVGMGVEGEFTAVDRPYGFTMTWIWISDDEPAQAHDDPVIDTVEVTFAVEDTGTVVTVRHTSTEHIAGGGAEQGWNDVLDRLPTHFSDEA
jgi:uncharacterized protein YndB with AHSA1/START domain